MSALHCGFFACADLFWIVLQDEAMVVEFLRTNNPRCEVKCFG